MGQASERSADKDSDLANPSRWNGLGFRVENAAGHSPESYRMDFKMKSLLAIAMIGCFSVSMLCGASVKTWQEVRDQYESEHFIPAALIKKSLKELGEIKI